MTKSKGKNNIGSRRRPRIQHLFTGIREPIMANAPNNSVGSLTSGSAGSATLAYALSPIGLSSVAFAGTTFNQQLVDVAHLKWLSNTSLNFGSYRVLRAKLIFVGNQGTTQQGTINLFGSKDAIDCGAGLNTAFVQGSGSKSFDLSSAGAKEISLNLPIDSSWKKVSQILAQPANVLPMQSGTSGAFVVCNTVNDLCFSGIAVQVVGATASLNCGNIFLDYDVEFKDPLSSSLNI